MKLYVVRHGETDWNKEKRLQGNHDIPLNEAGRSQAEIAREALKAYDFDVVFASPLVRAAETAEIINKDRGKPVFYDYRLRERNFGSCEGKTRDEYDYTELWDYEKNFDYGGEGIQTFFKRVWAFLDALKALRPAENVLVVCHGGTMRAIECYFNGVKDAEAMAAFFSKNAEVRTYEL